MDLKSILPNKKEEEEHFWSLIVEPEWVSAGIWKISEGKVQVLVVSPPSPWSTDGELISACDTSCSFIVQKISEDMDPPQKTVFGVFSSWVENGEIKNEYLVKIKKVCSELALTPAGFVVLSEALSNYFKSEEGNNVNAVFIGLSENNLEVSAFDQGKLIGVSQVARSVSLIEDVAEGLSRFSLEEAYPSRMILYNAKEDELEDARQDLIKADWENFKGIKFLHPPKIELVSSQTKIYAVSLAGGSEIGNAEKVVPIMKTSAADDEEFGKNNENEDINDNIPEEEDFSENSEQSNVKELTEDISPEDFGFTVDTTGIKREVAPDLNRETVFLNNNQKSFDKRPEGVHQDPIKEKRSIGKLPQKFFGIFSKIKFPKLSFNLKLGGARVILYGLIILLLLGIGFFAFWWFIPEAQVEIYVSPKRIDNEVEIAVNTNSSKNDLEDRTISGRVIEGDKQAEKSDATSGTKTIGDKATGEITIYRVGTSINLAKETLIKGPQGLNFSLDDEVKVASGSVLNRGVTKAKVSAKDIGAQYNLASGTTFSISNYPTSDMEAQNESAFSGGTSREVSAVSEDDQERLLKNLQGELENDLKSELSQKVSGDERLIEESLEFNIVKKEFDKKVGDEGTSLSLSLKLAAEGITVENSAIKDIGLKYLNQQVPEGYSLQGDQVTADFTFKNKKDNIYTILLMVGADLIPRLDTKNIAKNITGKFPQIAEDYFASNIPGYERAVIKINPIHFPGKLGTLPRITKNISITVNVEK